MPLHLQHLHLFQTSSTLYTAGEEGSQNLCCHSTEEENFQNIKLQNFQMHVQCTLYIWGSLNLISNCNDCKRADIWLGWNSAWLCICNWNYWKRWSRQPTDINSHMMGTTCRRPWYLRAVFACAGIRTQYTAVFVSKSLDICVCYWCTTDYFLFIQSYMYAELCHKNYRLQSYSTDET